MNNDEAWLEIDEATDVLISLRHANKCIICAKQEPGEWKWVILAVHNALQGAMVCHLSGSAQLGALRKDSIKKALSWHEEDRQGIEKDYPDEMLADANELFKRVIGDADIREGAGGLVIVTKDETNAFNSLHRLRREFAHFTPKGWSLELSGLPLIVSRCGGLIKKIAVAGWAFRHLCESDRILLNNEIEILCGSSPIE
ncbi:hypothetical protein [Aliiroseovarius sp. YM-037]|uniref:hypothetical protein n=1 Tax=Aliiroseovarius sp. YM-037 TaxID=3341728 RepID=UPI003A802917